MKNKFNFLIILILCSSKIFAGATSSVLTDTATGAATGAAASYVGNEIGKAAFPELSQKFGAFLSSPYGIATVSSVGMLNSYTLFQAASDQVDDSENNIKKIKVLMQTFQDSWADYCPNGRNDLNVPTCYCYLESGKKNTNRSNSETCKKLWATNDATNTATASNYNSTSTNTADVTGCITTSGAFDESCKCKRVVDSTGSNACQKVSSVSASSLGAGLSTYSSATGTNKLLDTVNQLSSGNIGVSNLNGANLAIYNSKVKGTLYPLIAASANNLKKAGIPGLLKASDVSKMQNSLISKKDMDTGSKMFASNTMPAVENKNLQAAIKAVEQKTGLELSGTGKGSAKKEENKNLNFNFNDSDSGKSSNNVDIGNEQKVYKIKGDINKDSNASLFEVISNRYLESGIRRLFPEN